MKKLETNKTVVTNETSLKLDEPLPPGQYRFQLVVENDKGILSDAVETMVIVQTPNPR